MSLVIRGDLSGNYPPEIVRAEASVSFDNICLELPSGERILEGSCKARARGREPRIKV